MRLLEYAEDDIYVTLRSPGGARQLERPEARSSALQDLGSSNDALAVLFRQVASPSYETLWFTRLAKRLGLTPVIIEHRTDRFCSHNPYKRSLATLSVVVGRNRHGRPILRRERLIEHTSAEGRPLEDLVTPTGESLVAYHHRRLLSVMGDAAPRTLDLSSLVTTASAGPRAYYVDIFKLMTGGVALFEDFVVDEQTTSFFRRVVKPAYDEAAALTGHRAQVVRMIPGRRAASPLWNAYPALRAEVLPFSMRNQPHVRLAS